MSEILLREATMFALNSNFRKLAWKEARKYWKPYMISQAAKMVKHIDAEKFTSWMRPGIRAQLVDIRKRTLVHDFMVEGDASSTHVLNAVSPAFTSSFPFAEWIVETHVSRP